MEKLKEMQHPQTNDWYIWTYMIICSVKNTTLSVWILSPNWVLNNCDLSLQVQLHLQLTWVSRSLSRCLCECSRVWVKIGWNVEEGASHRLFSSAFQTKACRISDIDTPQGCLYCQEKMKMIFFFLSWSASFFCSIHICQCEKNLVLHPLKGDQCLIKKNPYHWASFCFKL